MGPPSAGKKYTSTDGKFTVYFPVDATVKTNTQTVGDAPMAIAELTDKTGYLVAYTDLPVAAESVLAKPLLDAAEKAFTPGAKAMLIESSEIEVGEKKYPGREVLAELQDGKTRVRIVLAGSRMYAVGVGGPGDFATGRTGTLFLNSFSVTD